MWVTDYDEIQEFASYKWFFFHVCPDDVEKRAWTLKLLRDRILKNGLNVTVDLADCESEEEEEQELVKQVNRQADFALEDLLVEQIAGVNECLTNLVDARHAGQIDLMDYHTEMHSILCEYLGTIELCYTQFWDLGAAIEEEQKKKEEEEGKEEEGKQGQDE